MIVFDLKCGAGHVFECWFASSAAWEEQQGAGQVQCPFCGNAEVAKAVMAPRLQAKGNRENDRTIPVATGNAARQAEAQAMLSALQKMQSALLDGSTWVGERFDREARAMDAGQQEQRAIHGEVTADQARALLEDGVAVMPLPFPVIPPEKRN